MNRCTGPMRTNNMPKTLLISEIFPPVNGGSGRWFWELYRRLPREDYVIAAGESPQAAAFDKTHDLHVTRLPLSSNSWGLLSLTGLGFYWRSLALLIKLMRANNIQKVHCGRCLPEGVMGLLLKVIKGTPYLCYIHGEDVETASSSRELSFLVSRVLRHASVLICNSRNTQSILLERWKVPEEKTRVLHPGMDAERFVPAPYSIEVRDSLGWGNRPVILTVGRLQKRKGHDMLIQALPSIREHIPNILYAVVGEGEEEAQLKKLGADYNVEESVLFMGAIADENLIECYQQCTLFALPNRNVNGDIEGFGMVLVEAQSCGKTVLAGDSGGTKETMIPGLTGHIINCENPKIISACLIDLISQKKIGVTSSYLGREFVVNNFSWDAHSVAAAEIFSRFKKITKPRLA